MREEWLIAIVMLGVALVGGVLTKNSRKWSVAVLLAAALAGSLAAGMGVRFRELVEGPFGFLDVSLSVFAGWLFARRKSELAEHGANIIIHANHLLRSAFPAMQKTAELTLQHGRTKEADQLCLSIKEILTLIPTED